MNTAYMAAGLWLASNVVLVAWLLIKFRKETHQ